MFRNQLQTVRNSLRLLGSRGLRNARIVIILALLSGCANFNNAELSDTRNFNDRQLPAVDPLALVKMTRGDCGLRCLARVLSCWGCQKTVQNLRQLAGNTPDKGYSLGQLADVAHSLGFLAYVVSSSVDELERHCLLGRPCIVVLTTDTAENHAVVVLQVNQKSDEQPTLRIADPQRDVVEEMSVSTFTRRWKPLGAPMLLVAGEHKGGMPM